MRVLVTGGAGFIGSHLTDALLERGDDVTVADTLITGRRARLHDGLALHEVSIIDAPALADLAARTRPEVICHLAAQIDVRVSVTDPAADAATNVIGTINVLEAARSVGARVVFASTGGALYGADAKIPSPEEVPPEPEAPYGTAKYCAEQYIGLFNRLHGGRHAVLRLGNVYGPRQSPGGEAGVVSIFCGRVRDGRPPVIFGDGLQTRDYVYVGDVVRAFLAAADAGRPGTWNIGTATETSVLDLVALVGQAAGVTVVPSFEPARPGELQRSALEVSRAAEGLGWRPSTSVRDGIAKVYAWVRDGEPDRGKR